MAVSYLTFKTLVTNAATAVQGACQTTLDLTVGSVTRALLEAVSSVALWLQYLILQVLTTTRLATSQGADVDSWVGDFGLSRLPGTAATGSVLFTSFTPSTSSAVVPVGATVRTATALTFTVYADTTNPAYNASQNGYVRTLGTATVTAPVQANVAGSTGNVGAGVINLLGTAIPGIDTVSNPNALVNAEDSESDAALRARFVTYINSLSQGTLGAINNAISNVQAGILFQVKENSDTSGNFEPGNFVVIVDDGSGNPPKSLLTAVYAAVDIVRPIGVSFAVIAPTVLNANVAMQLTLASGANSTTIVQSITTAITSYLAGVQVGASASYSRIIQLVYAVDSADIQNISNVTLNNGTSDLPAVFAQAIRAGSINVTVAS